jgi:hypothetical protein
LEIALDQWKFVFSYSDPDGWNKKIWDIIDIRCKIDQKVLDNVKYSDDGTTLTIWDVWDLWVFSSVDGQWARNFLIIW